jgi:hypothetical protein
MDSIQDNSQDLVVIFYNDKKGEQLNSPFSDLWKSVTF